MKLGGAEGFLIGFGTTNDDEYLWWNLGGWGNTRHAVERFRSGGSNVIGSNTLGSIESNRWYDIKVELTEDRIRCYLDSVLVHDFAYRLNDEMPQLAASCVRETSSGDTILKIVSNASNPVKASIDLSSLDSLGTMASKTVLSGSPDAKNRHGEPAHVLPVTSTISMAPNLELELPAHSLTVLRINAR